MLWKGNVRIYVVGHVSAGKRSDVWRNVTVAIDFNITKKGERTWGQECGYEFDLSTFLFEFATETILNRTLILTR